MCVIASSFRIPRKECVAVRHDWNTNEMIQNRCSYDSTREWCKSRNCVSSVLGAMSLWENDLFAGLIISRWEFVQSRGTKTLAEWLCIITQVDLSIRIISDSAGGSMRYLIWAHSRTHMHTDICFVRVRHSCYFNMKFTDFDSVPIPLKSCFHVRTLPWNYTEWDFCFPAAAVNNRNFSRFSQRKGLHQKRVCTRDHMHTCWCVFSGQRTGKWLCLCFHFNFVCLCF